MDLGWHKVRSTSRDELIIRELPLLHVQFLGEGVAVTPPPYPARRKRGRKATAPTAHPTSYPGTDSPVRPFRTSSRPYLGLNERMGRRGRPDRAAAHPPRPRACARSPA